VLFDDAVLYNAEAVDLYSVGAHIVYLPTVPSGMCSWVSSVRQKDVGNVLISATIGYFQILNLPVMIYILPL